MKFEIVSKSKSRGRGGVVFLRISLCPLRDNEAQAESRTSADAQVSITDALADSPFLDKDVGDTVEIG